MHKIIPQVISLLLYISFALCENSDSQVQSDGKREQANMYPYFFYPAMFYYPYYPIPPTGEDNQKEKDKPFGGDRSDPWLYPPRSYYVHWADTEEQNDWDNWDKWGQWQAWHRRQP